ncbi:MAG: aminoacyl-tRNA hydrolase [Rickettsiaceae bacterium]
MFLIVGLGNPGSEYARTRHNTGFFVLDLLASKHNASWQDKPKFSGQIASISMGPSEVILCKPETYMNLSGVSVQAVSSFYKIPPDQIIVIHDDIDLPLGKIGYKIGGGAGGHNGLKSIDKSIGPNYHRIRMGLGRPEDQRYQVADFVLGKFTPTEEEIIAKASHLVVSNINLIISGEFEKFKKSTSSPT